MDIDGARRFIREHHWAVLTTYYRDGRAQVSPITAGIDEAGRAVISAREDLVKTRNLARDPRAVLCVFTDAFFGDWVYIEGRAEILRLPEAMEPLIDYFRQVAGEHSDWAEYREAMAREKRVLIRIEITKAGPAGR